jgi:hypothetical protein
MTCDNTNLIPSTGNIFADLGYVESEATAHKMRSEALIASEMMLAERQGPEAS